MSNIEDFTFSPDNASHFLIINNCSYFFLQKPDQRSHSDGKTWKNGKAFSSQGLEKSGNFRQMFFIIYSDVEMNCVLFDKMDQVFSLKAKHFKKYWKSKVIMAVQKSRNHV